MSMGRSQKVALRQREGDIRAQRMAEIVRKSSCVRVLLLSSTSLIKGIRN